MAKANKTKVEPERITEDKVITPEVNEVFESKVLGENTKLTPATPSDLEISRIANQRERNLRESWAKERKATIMVPLKPGEERIKPIPMAYANINGVSIKFPKNEYVELPESVAQLFLDSENQTNRAISSLRVDLDNEKTEALS